MEYKHELPIMSMDTTETNCCPRFEPEIWDEKIFELTNLPMVRAATRSFFYVPLNMAKVMTKTMNQILEQGAATTDKYLILSEDISPWKCNNYFLVQKPVKGLENVSFSGNFYTKVFEGDFKEIPDGIAVLKKSMERQDLKIGRILSFYTTCPKCAKIYGKNYIVLFGEVVQ